jgi:hypothetical protein
MQPAVVVEIDGAQSTASEVDALLETCEVGMRGLARCVLASAQPGSDAVAFASVTWQGPGDAQASVEVRLRGQSGEIRKARELAFVGNDPVIERWRATGFAIATVVGDILAEEQEAKPAPSTSPSSSQGEPPRAPASEPQARWWLDGRFAVARGVEGSPFALGGELGVSRRLDPDRWFVSATLGFSAQQAHGVDLLRPSAALGLGILAPRVWNHLAFALRVEPRLELLDASGQDATGARGHAGRWAPGLSEALDALWMPSEGFGVVAGAELRELSGATAIQAHGQLVALVPAVDFAVQAGLRYGLP